MNRYMLSLGVSFSLLVASISSFASENNPINFSIKNDSDSTVLIMFERYIGAEPRAKLLEAGESIDFGKVYEASVQSYSTLWGYIAPAKHILFSAGMLPYGNQVDRVVIRIKGISGRSLFNPFGHWDYERTLGKGADEFAIQTGQFSSVATVLDAFPTAKRKIMYTPRYILGLPQDASLDDAVEASLMLESKWHARFSVQTNTSKLVSNIAHIIFESRKAFQHGQADVPLHIPVEMRSSLPSTDPEDDTIPVSWS